MKTILLLALLASCNTNSADCVDIWQFFDGHDWVSVEESHVAVHYTFGTRVITDTATYYSVPVRVVKVCNQGKKK